MLPLLRALLPLLNVAGLVFVATRRRLLRTLRSSGADAPDRAVPVEGSGLTAWWLKRLTRVGVFHQTPAGRYWIDQEGYGRYRRVRLVRVAVVMGVVILAWIASTMRPGL